MRSFRVYTPVALALAMLLIAGAADSTNERPAKLRGPYLLVTLPSLGAVTWTCDTAAARYPSFALGYRASPRYATTSVELRAGGHRVARRVVQPGQRLRLPFSSARTQTLSFVQGTGAGTLQASVFVNFVPNTPVNYCSPYSPPSLKVRVSPRG